MEDLSHRISNSLDLEECIQRKLSGIFDPDKVGTNKFSDYGVEMRLKKLSTTHIGSKKFAIF